MKVFVDTSALLALLDEDDLHHVEAGSTFRSLVEDAELVTHNYVHVEAIAVTRRRLGSGATARLIDAFLPLMTTIWIDERLHAAAIEAHRAAPGPSLTDHVSFVVMRHEGIEVAFAFDRDFETAGFRRPSAADTGPGDRLSEAHALYAAGGLPGVDLVSVAEIAERSGRSVNTIQSWRRRHVDFPSPVATLAAGPVWIWPPVEHWIDARVRPRRPGSLRERVRMAPDDATPIA
jgi:predicted nucleic acid-binding protein